MSVSKERFCQIQETPPRLLSEEVDFVSETIPRFWTSRLGSQRRWLPKKVGELQNEDCPLLSSFYRPGGKKWLALMRNLLPGKHGDPQASHAEKGWDVLRLHEAQSLNLLLNDQRRKLEGKKMSSPERSNPTIHSPTHPPMGNCKSDITSMAHWQRMLSTLPSARSGT